MRNGRNNSEHTMQVTPVEKPSVLLADKVHQRLEGFAVRMESTIESVVQVQIPLGKLHPVQWLREQAHNVKVFWESRDGSFFSAAVDDRLSSVIAEWSSIPPCS